MKLVAAGLLIAVIGSATSARADGIQDAIGALSTILQVKGGGLAPIYPSCPKSNNDDWFYISSAVFVPISQRDSAVLINTGMCNGGNGSANISSSTEVGCRASLPMPPYKI
jgi:hypothetical protein